jgi:hypothetical protein
MTISCHKFNKIAKGKRDAPFSLRLTFEERAKLEAAANGVALAAYIKAVLFAVDLPQVRRRNAEPVKDHQALGSVLSALGRSSLSSNLNQLARAVNTGTLPVHPETEAELRNACREIKAKRADLMQALGLDGGAP